MCSEHIFSNDVLSHLGQNNLASFGWWVTIVSRRHIFFKTCSDMSQLTSSDLRIFDYLQKKGLDVFLVTTLGDVLFFLKIDSDGNMTDLFDLQELLSRFRLTKKSQPLIATENTRNKDRQNEAIRFMEQNGILEEVAFNRYFANYILSVYFGYCVWNIDVFIASKDNVIAYEIKYKYPTKNNKYGINLGATNLFKWLMNDLRIEVYHYILDNPTNDENLSVLDLVKSHAGKAKWISCKLENHHLNDDISIAPSKTQITGSREQKVRYLDAREFQFVKYLLYP